MATRVRLAMHRPNRSVLATGLIAVGLAMVVGLATAKLGSFQHQLKALVIIAGVLTLVAAALRPEFGLMVLLALMPIRIPFFGTNSDQALLVSLALVLAWRIRVKEVPTWALVGGIALATGSFLATISAHEPQVAVEGAIDWLCALVLLFVAFSVLSQRLDAHRRMVSIFLGSAVIMVIFGFLQKSGIDSIVGREFIRGLPNSFLAYYTVYAGYVAIAATLATGEILASLDERRVVRAFTFGVALLVMLAALTSSTSRGGLVALAAGWLMLLVLNIQRAGIVARLIVIIAIFASAGYVATPRSTIERIERRISTSGTTRGEDKTRFALHKVGEEGFKSHPFGLGYGNFPYYLNSKGRSQSIAITYDHAHETPVQIGLDSGWLGLAGFLTLWATPLIIAVTRRTRGGGLRASACAAALAGLMAQGLYDYLFYDLAFLMAFLVLVWGFVHAASADQQIILPGRLVKNPPHEPMRVAAPNVISRPTGS
jgi:O-antigen ligase